MDAVLGPIRALGDESRLRILWMLEERYLCVCEIQAALSLAQSTVSRHMMVLEEAGFVISEKDGLWKNYSLNPLPPPLAASLLAAVRLHAAGSGEARGQREKARDVRRENLCCKGAP